MAARESEMIKQNKTAWEAEAYETWVEAYGPPDEVARQLAADPEHKLKRLLPFLGDIRDRDIANPLGSHGRVAVSMALLGARVTVFDISESNQRYALELARAAEVSINYVVGPFQEVSENLYRGRFDLAVMELGIVHWFLDLDLFVRKLAVLLRDSGRMILNEFHPLVKKAVSITDGKAQITGDYFADEINETPVPYTVLQGNPNPDLPHSLVRHWTIGEIVTAFAQGGFRIDRLVETPSKEFPRLPAMFTLVASKV